MDGPPPTISGSAVQGQTLTDDHRSWSNSPSGYSYQWEDCDSTGSNCQAITGATGETYILGAGDVGSTIRVVETASNASGAGSPATLSGTQPAPLPAPAPGQTMTQFACAFAQQRSRRSAEGRTTAVRPRRSRSPSGADTRCPRIPRLSSPGSVCLSDNEDRTWPGVVARVRRGYGRTTLSTSSTSVSQL